MPPRVKAHPFLTLMAVVSAILILVGRVNRDMWWGNWVFRRRNRGARGCRRPLPPPDKIVGFGLLAVAVLMRRSPASRFAA
jgi:hypothetical protein